jgi:uncharacterized repeat protein (TIGR03803 family)
MTAQTQKCAIATLLTVLITMAALAAQLPAQEPSVGASAVPATVNVTYRFLHDGITQSGYSHGELVYDEVLQGADGNFYGTTTLGGSGLCTGPFGVQGCGTVYKLTPAGVQTVIHNFALDSNGTTAVNGIYPYGGLVQGPDGSLYGTTTGGGNVGAVCNGNLGCGVVFKLTLAGRYTILHTFSGALANPPEGGSPGGRLVLATDGKLYGTTYSGGDVQNYANQGTIFSVTTGGAFTTVYMFDNVHGTTDGANPYAGLIQGKDGAFYGTTQFGGTSNAGTVFKYSGGKTTVLHSFPEQSGGFFPDGAYPYAALVQASDGNFYGVTSFGGALTTYYQSGTLFRITKQGTFTKLWDFNATDPSVNGIDGYGALIQASDGNLYGTTMQGGSANAGTIFQMTLAGALTQILSFDSVTDGAYPRSVPLQASDGTLYFTTSTTTNGTDQGDVVQIANGLAAPAPVITRFSPTSGKVASKVTITGKNFVGTTNVAFQGTAATFTVKSITSLVATVPTGAASGHITVTNAGGTATSAASFTVLP